MTFNNECVDNFILDCVNRLRQNNMLGGYSSFKVTAVFIFLSRLRADKDRYKRYF